MGPWQISLYGLAGLLVLMGLGMPIAFAMMIVGVGGLVSLIGLGPALGMLGQLPVSNTMSYELSVVPMFVLMGIFVDRAGISHDLYRTCYAFLGHRRGGVAMATILACGGFAAVCGSSIATAATMAKVAIPAMRRYRYKDSLASAVVAAGGTLGILIPPSVILVIYGILTATDIGKLFIAGILPGLVAIALYILTVALVTWRDPTAGPRGERSSWYERLASLSRVGPVLALFVLIIGGIYFGIFTPTEAAGVGAFGAFLFALWRRALTIGVFMECVIETARTSAVLFIILIGALLFSNFVNMGGLTAALQTLITDVGVSPLSVILMMMMIYLVLGCFLESLSMVLLTVPIFFPIVMALGYDPIWFGVIVVVVTELSLITPPVGLNLFVIQHAIGDLPLRSVYRGIVPFVVTDVVRLALLIGVPSISLLLPRLAG